METMTTGPSGPTAAVEAQEVPTAATGATAPVEATVDEVDYKAELEASKEREAKTSKERDNYRTGLLVAKGKKPDDGSVIVADKAELEKLIDERATVIAKKHVPAAVSTVDSILGQLSGNPDERELIRHIYENRLAHTGTDEADIRADLEEAQLIANKKAVKKTISELKVAAQARPTPGSGAGSSTAAPQQVGDPSFTPAQLAELKKRGIDPEKVRQNFGKLPGFPSSTQQ